MDYIQFENEEKTRFVFVSHTAADTAFFRRHVLPVTQQLYLDCHFANFSTGGAELYRKSILRSLRRCAWFLVILSPRAVESRWVKFEVKWAMRRRRRERIIPVMAETCNPSALHQELSEFDLIDFFLNPNQAKLKLLSAFSRAEVFF